MSLDKGTKEEITKKFQLHEKDTGSADVQIAILTELSTRQLQAKYEEVFGEPPRSRHKTHLIKRIAWRLQALGEGDLSQRARRRAEELANDADLRLTAPASGEGEDRPPPPRRTSRQHLPRPGTVLTRIYRDRTIEVTVLVEGFAYEGQLYRSLSAVAKAVTGKHWNGYHFFGLWKPTPKGTIHAPTKTA